MGWFCTFRNHHFLGGVFLDRLRKESKKSWTLHPAWEASCTWASSACSNAEVKDLRNQPMEKYVLRNMHMGTICRYDPICHLKCLSKDCERIETTQRISKDVFWQLSDMVQPEWEIQSFSFHSYFCHNKRFENQMCRSSWHVNVVFLHIKSTWWNGNTHVQHQVTSQSPWRLLWSHREKTHGVLLDRKKIIALASTE